MWSRIAKPSKSRPKERYSNTGEYGVSDAAANITGSPAPSSIERSASGSTQSTYVGQGFFQGAHDFAFNGPVTMIDGVGSEGPAMDYLKQRGVPEAEVDSSARHPPPRCHSETRKALRQRMMTWLSDAPNGRDITMLWLLGPAGVGKSAVAQTIAEDSPKLGRLVAAFFFANQDERDDPLRVIPTLAYRLAVHDKGYQQLVAQVLRRDSTILKASLRTQFEKLIVEPFATNELKSRCQHDPFLIILDGLDECKDESAQCEFIDLIDEYTRFNRLNSPLLFMVCSRPEAHLKRLFPRVDHNTACKREDLFVDDDEAKQDVYRVLRDGLAEIYARWPELFDVREGETWPPEENLRQLAQIASGLFVFASTVLKFVGDNRRRNPQEQFRICLEFLASSYSSGENNPLHALDLLYRRVLSEIHPSDLIITRRILSLLILFPAGFRTHRFVVDNVANFLCIKRGTLYSALDRLHSVLAVPPHDKANRDVIRLYHASFSDFLRDPNRSQSFAFEEGTVRRELAVFTIRWYNYLIQCFCNLQDDTICRRSLLVDWDSKYRNQGIEGYLPFSLTSYLLRLFWDVAQPMHDEDVPVVMEELHLLNFSHFMHTQATSPRFPTFVTWLFNLGSRNGGLIRLEPTSETDRRLFEKHGGPFVQYLPTNLSADTRFYVVSLHHTLFPSEPQWKDVGMLWLGHEERSCLVVAYQDPNVPRR